MLYHLLLWFIVNYFTAEDIPSAEYSSESDDLQVPAKDDYVLSYRSYLSEVQKERVITFIQEIQPKVTVFVAVMQKRNVQPPGPFLVNSLLILNRQLTSLNTNLLVVCTKITWEI